MTIPSSHDLSPVTTRAQWVVLVLFLFLCLGIGSLGAAWTNLSVTTWYNDLHKPTWNPPNWVFGPVWTTLYVMMAIAAWLVWRERGLSSSKMPLALFAVQLALNAAWSGLFFGLRNPGLALGEIVLLWSAIVATTVSFARISGWASLLVPYLGWVSFAVVLNGVIWWANR